MLGMIGFLIYKKYVYQVIPNFCENPFCHLTLWNVFRQKKNQIGDFSSFWGVSGMQRGTQTEIDEGRDQTSEELKFLVKMPL